MPHHLPPFDVELRQRAIPHPDGRRILCPRPEITLPVQTRKADSLYPLTFVVDTGSDVTMIPEARARRLRIAGYDASAVVVETGTTFHGRLRGRWGTIGTRIGRRELELPCFFFAEVLPVAGWFESWLASFSKEKSGVEGPFVLGRAGVFPPVSLLIERGRVALSDQPFR